MCDICCHINWRNLLSFFSIGKAVYYLSSAGVFPYKPRPVAKTTTKPVIHVLGDSFQQLSDNFYFCTSIHFFQNKKPVTGNDYNYIMCNIVLEIKTSELQLCKRCVFLLGFSDATNRIYYFKSNCF